MVEDETAMRKIITGYISEHMEKDVDYGTIQLKGKDGRAFESKPSLFKAGAEKFGSLMKLRPDIQMDRETWEMSGSKPGVFCYKCYLYNPDGKIVGMGLGACTLEEKYNSYNNAIKIAKKRAFVDAILTTGALSDFFTQDLEDGGADKEYPASAKQLNYITSLLNANGKTKAQLEVYMQKKFSSSVADMTSDQASDVIGKLLGKNGEEPKEEISDKEMDEISKKIDQEVI